LLILASADSCCSFLPLALCSLAGSDRLLLYTDGLIEARDAAGSFLPRTAIDAALRAPDAEACLDMLLESVHAHAGRFDDDLALLLLTRTPSA
jgi:serine phosphatase RsbU (regulator of sigma subunit)